MAQLTPRLTVQLTEWLAVPLLAQRTERLTVQLTARLAAQLVTQLLA